jgi:hypothetical protein
MDNPDTDNFRHKIKTNKPESTTQKTKTVSNKIKNQGCTPSKTGSEPKCLQRVISSCSL